MGTEEEIATREADLNRNVREEVQRNTSRQREAPTTGSSRPSNHTFVGFINPKHVSSHAARNAPTHEASQAPQLVPGTYRTADYFFEEMVVLTTENLILKSENRALRLQLQRFMTPIRVVPPSSPKDQA